MDENKKDIINTTEKNEIDMNKKSELDEVRCVEYTLVDAVKYSFEYKYSDDVNINMFEADRTFENNEFVDADFCSSVDEKDYTLYTLSVASGVLTGILEQLELRKETLDKIKEWSNKDWEKYILIVAQMIGYTKSDYKEAVCYLKDRFVPFLDKQLKKEVSDGYSVFMNDLSKHPTIAGLAFSILSQLGGKRFTINELGMAISDLPDYYALGRNLAEKIIYGLLYWIFYLAYDVAASKRVLLEELKIPKEIIKLLKDLYKQLPFSNIPDSFEETEKIYSEFIKDIFQKRRYKNDDGNEEVFDIENLIGKMSIDLFTNNIPILVNECFVRGLYLIQKLKIEIKEKGISSIDEFNKIDIQNILPFNNRTISRMVFISSACFAGVNVAGATVKAVYNKIKNGGRFSKTLLAEINIAGIGRFIFACIADSKYWGDDIRILFQRKEKNKNESEDGIKTDNTSKDNYQILSLDASQTRALYSLEALLTLKDIEKTEKKEDRDTKQLWLKMWKKSILKGLGIDSFEYFVENEKEVYRALCTVEPTEENCKWFYLMTTELVVFNPYHMLGSSEDEKFKKLRKEKYNYIDDQFVRKQTIVSQAEVNQIRKEYRYYHGIVSGKTASTIISTSIAVISVATTGGLAYILAPTIAPLIAGEAVMGLHGAALTSASLAFVGGGSLAAGGLGVAGGTAIITGGGALLGIAGSGTASLVTILSITNNEYWLRQVVKMLAFCKSVLKDRLNDIGSIEELIVEIESISSDVNSKIKELEVERCSLDQDTIKHLKDYLKYLNRCNTELKKICK